VLSAVLMSCTTAQQDPASHDHEHEPTAEVSSELVSYDCSTKTDTGYTNGKPFEITLVTVDGDPVEIETANAFLTMAQAAEADGILLKINSGFRTPEEQQYYYDCYKNCNCNDCNEAAAPGYSNHQSGHALDLNTSSAGVYTWLTNNGGKYGFKRTVPSEEWHWEWWGGGSPKSFCSAGACTSGECEQLTVQAPVLYAAPSTTDLDGDGRADICGRGGAGILCHLATPEGFGEEQLLVPFSNENGWSDPSNFATIRMGDVDGDGRADLCARSNTSMRCYTSGTTPLGTLINGPAWSDDKGWGATRYYATIRLADIDGDGKEDLCARAGKGLICHRSTGTGFEEESLAGPAWSDESGFGAARYYTTLRMGDVDGDGKADACIRHSKGMQCVLSDGAGFPTTVEGPAWSDASGWDSPIYHGSIRLADVNGDGKADLCARASKGLICTPSDGEGFGPSIQSEGYSDKKGWDVEPYWPTMLFASPMCHKKPETCNGKDDDCDGLADEDGVCDQGGGGQGQSAGAGGTPGQGGQEPAGGSGGDPAGSGAAGNSAGSDGAEGGQGGSSKGGGSGGKKSLAPTSEESGQEGGCQVQHGGGQAPRGALLALLAMLGLGRRRAAPGRRRGA
jgi:MYXO-CTERM domain-containing protein